MDKTPTTQHAADCSPVFSMAGVMPAASEMTWTTAYPNPDAGISAPRPAGHAVSLSIAGVMPGRPETAWRTAMPDPTRDVLDAHGHITTIAEADSLAAVAPRAGVLALQAATLRIAARKA
jgi:hypothetical protein